MTINGGLQFVHLPLLLHEGFASGSSPLVSCLYKRQMDPFTELLQCDRITQTIRDPWTIKYTLTTNRRHDIQLQPMPVFHSRYQITYTTVGILLQLSELADRSCIMSTSCSTVYCPRSYQCVLPLTSRRSPLQHVNNICMITSGRKNVRSLEDIIW